MLIHPDVTISSTDNGQVQLVDRRTNARFDLGDAGVFFEQDGSLTVEAQETLMFLGADCQHPLQDLRALHSRLRSELRTEERRQAVNESLIYILENIPFFRSWLADKQTQLDALSDLQMLPIMSKRDYRLNFNNLLPDDFEMAGLVKGGHFDIAYTSGTSEDRLKAISDLHLERVPPDYETVWGLKNLPSLPLTAVLTGPLCTGELCSVRSAPREERIRYRTTLFLNTTPRIFSLREQEIRSFVDDLWWYRPDLLLVNPAYLAEFARCALASGMKLPPVHAILTSYQYCSKIWTRDISNMLQTPVFNVYTATELSGCQIGVECRYGRMHVFDDHVMVEIVRDGRWVEQGQIGRILVTTLTGDATRLLRYDTGDIGRWVTEACPCELGNWPCIELHGRARDMLRIANRSITTKDVDDLLSKVEGVAHYQCEQSSPDALRLSIIPKRDEFVDQGSVAALFDQYFGAKQIAITFTSRLDLERSMKLPQTRNAVPIAMDW